MRVRRVRLIILTMGVAAATWIGWSIVRAKILPERFERIAIGDPREQVVRLLGKPRRIEKCGEPFGNPGGKLGCTEDYLYASPYAPLIPEYWSVSFDKNGRVIDKYHYVSP